LQERELKELRQQLEAAQLEARLLRGRLAVKEEEMLKKDQEVKTEKVGETFSHIAIRISPIRSVCYKKSLSVLGIRKYRYLCWILIRPVLIPLDFQKFPDPSLNLYSFSMKMILSISSLRFKS
jgi:hypothetical protein